MEHETSAYVTVSYNLEILNEKRDMASAESSK